MATRTISEEAVQKVIRALENEDYDWRTLDGLSNETGLTPSEVQEVLYNLQGAVIQSSIPDKQGRALFTTRSHYKKNQSVGNRILSALSDTVK
jgi:hypothetical protein